MLLFRYHRVLYTQPRKFTFTPEDNFIFKNHCVILTLLYEYACGMHMYMYSHLHLGGYGTHICERTEADIESIPWSLSTFSAEAQFSLSCTQRAPIWLIWLASLLQGSTSVHLALRRRASCHTFYIENTCKSGLCNSDLPLAL